MASPQYALPADPRRKVFRKLVAILQADPILRRLVGDPARSGGWHVWDGKPGDEDAFGTSEGVAVRLTPDLGPMSWLDETEMTAELGVELEFLLEGTDADDPLDFQGVVERAIYPAGQGETQTLANALQALGAVTGLVSFVPSNDPQKAARADGKWYGRGRLGIEVRRVLNP